MVCVENHRNDADNTAYWNKNEHNLLTGNILLFVVVNITRSSISQFCLTYEEMFVCVCDVCDEMPASKLSTLSTEFIFIKMYNISSTPLIPVSHYTILNLCVFFCVFSFPSFNHSFVHSWSGRSGINAGFSFLVVHFSPNVHMSAHVREIYKSKKYEELQLQHIITKLHATLQYKFV